MNKLIRFYIRSMSTALLVIIAIMLFVNLHVLPFFSNTMFRGFLKNVLPSIIILWSELFVRKILWRIKGIGIPRLDFNGTWSGKTSYEQEMSNRYKGFLSEHKMVIEQDCLNIRILSTDSTAYVNWGSKMAAVQEDDTLLYYYWVNYNIDERFPNRKVHGIEELKIANNINNLSRPSRLTGTFNHCFENDEPTYKGTVVFTKE